MAPKPFKIPESVLVVIHTAALDVLLIQRADAKEFWQHQNSLGIAGRETAIRRFAPGQPQRGQMLARVQAHRRALRDAQTEHMLGVACHARRVAMAPLRINVIDVLHAPIEQARTKGACRGAIDTGLLQHLARHSRLSTLLALSKAPRQSPTLGLVLPLYQDNRAMRLIDEHNDTIDRDLWSLHVPNR